MGIRVPSFTYTGGTADAYSGNQYWYIFCRTSDTENGARLKLKYDKKVDIFLVGGGGAGASGNGASGGAGGDVLTVKGVNLAKDVEYAIRIGAGGVGRVWQSGQTGGQTSFRLSEAQTYIAKGGAGGILYNSADKYDVGAPGASGRSGGGAGTYKKGEAGGAGGKDGGAGGSTSQASGGSGKGGTTRGFGKAINNNDGVTVPDDTPRPYSYFAGGGGGSARNKEGGPGGEGTNWNDGGGGRGGGELDGVTNIAGGNGITNTGGGGGGSSGNGDLTPAGGNGGSGIIIIRSTMPDYLPVYFNGTRLTDIYYKVGTDGTRHKLETLSFNKDTIF